MQVKTAPHVLARIRVDDAADLVTAALPIVEFMSLP